MLLAQRTRAAGYEPEDPRFKSLIACIWSHRLTGLGYGAFNAAMRVQASLGLLKETYSKLLRITIAVKLVKTSTCKVEEAGSNLVIIKSLAVSRRGGMANTSDSKSEESRFESEWRE